MFLCYVCLRQIDQVTYCICRLLHPRNMFLSLIYHLIKYLHHTYLYEQENIAVEGQIFWTVIMGFHEKEILPFLSPVGYDWKASMNLLHQYYLPSVFAQKLGHYCMVVAFHRRTFFAELVYMYKLSAWHSKTVNSSFFIFLKNIGISFVAIMNLSLWGTSRIKCYSIWKQLLRKWPVK